MQLTGRASFSPGGSREDTFFNHFGHTYLLYFRAVFHSGTALARLERFIKLILV